MRFAAGTRVGPYEIVGWLGAGGMGEVYRARDPRLGRDVALKLILETFAADASRLHRFEQEARAAGQLNHPNILAVHDFGSHAGAPYIVSELLDGESLRDRLRSGPLPPRKVVDYARQVASGLAAAHDKGIIHRDVKPDNLFITSDGRIKILDFGIAKLTTPSDERSDVTTLPTSTAAAMVVGTAAYMSPEQVRGETVDARSDLFSVGAVLHEMLTGRSPFVRETAADTMAAVLNEEPRDPLPTSVPPTVARITSRCLEKSREMRFQSARDLAFAFEMSTETGAAVSTTGAAQPRRWPTIVVPALVVLALILAAANWLGRDNAPMPPDNPLSNAQFTRFTDWEGEESGAEISPDGKFVAFVADRSGRQDVWLSQVGTGRFRNLTGETDPVRPIGSIFRKVGFSTDGGEIWFSPDSGPAMAQMIVPLVGGSPRAFLDRAATAPAWSPDGLRLTFFKNLDGDPLFVADRTGTDARQILEQQGMHHHNPVWSTDGQWIYFARGAEPTDAMDVWRIRPTGESLEKLTDRGIGINHLAPIDTRTVLYSGRGEDGSGPWLWSLDVETKQTRHVSTGLGQYLDISADRSGRHLVATVANPSASLWQVPILDRQAEDRDVRPYEVPTRRARAPRFAGTSLFYLSSSGTGDGLWRVEAGQESEVWKGADGGLSEPAAISPDRSHVAIIVRREGKRRLVVISTDGRSSRTLAPAIEIAGAAGVGTADWSPDGTFIVTGGRDADGPGLFKIPVDGGAPTKLIAGRAELPLWSPDGKLIVYAGKFFTGQVELLAVRPDGSPVELPPLRTRPGGYRFLPNGTALVYLPFIPSLDFWHFDFATKRERPLTRLSDRGALTTFDITPDGKSIVFDRTRPNGDIVLIDLPK